jgi:hypothetical protein
VHWWQLRSTRGLLAESASVQNFRAFALRSGPASEGAQGGSSHFIGLDRGRLSSGLYSLVETGCNWRKGEPTDASVLRERSLRDPAAAIASLPSERRGAGIAHLQRKTAVLPTTDISVTCCMHDRPGVNERVASIRDVDEGAPARTDGHRAASRSSVASDIETRDGISTHCGTP